MNETKISWTNVTWNPTHGCSKVSDGCRFCYAETLSRRYGQTPKPWTVPNESENVLLKPHKLADPYKLKEPSKVFVNSMSDLFHQSIPDWYRAVVFCIMLDLPQHVFQVLTKRADDLIDWPARFTAAIFSAEFFNFRSTVKNPKVKAALTKIWDSPWGDNIWQGVSAESARVLIRLDYLRMCGAKVKFVSAEPLLGAWGNADLTGIDWIIVGGESGLHMKDLPERWMGMDAAREIRDLCVKQGVAFFFKQGSGLRTETDTYLVEEDGTRWQWHQYPGDLAAPIEVDAKGRPMRVELPDYDMPWAEYLPPSLPLPDIRRPTTRVVAFPDVRSHWDKTRGEWDSSEYVYIGRRNYVDALPESQWANPFHITEDMPRASSIDHYRNHMKVRLVLEPHLQRDLEALRGKILVCWCKKAGTDTPCHGDVLRELLGEIELKPETTTAPATQDGLRQLALL